MEDLNAWNLIVAALVPLAVGLVVRATSSRAVRAVIGTAVSIVVAAVTYGLTEGWDFDEGYVVAAAATIAIAAATLETFWRPTGIYEWWRDLTTPAS